MSDSERVTCDEHGDSVSTFVCQHVAHGVACGFHAAKDADDDEWPDAWCDRCEEAFQAADGEWNDEGSTLADIQLLCTVCYETARERNREVPPLARGVAAQLTTEEADAFIHHATHAMQAVQAVAEEKWGFNAMAKWYLDSAAGTLTFSDPVRPTIVADVRHVGSFSTKSNTFQWAWETFEGDDPRADDVSRIRVFGDARGIAKLAIANFPAEEADGWAMAAVAGYLLHTEALYRPPIQHTSWFLLLSNFRLAS